MESDIRHTKTKAFKTQPQLIGLDWGTSSLRAYLLGQSGAVFSQVSLPLGIMQLRKSSKPNSGSTSEAFRSAFERAVGKWLRMMPSLPVIASGMVGSRQGWREAPYLNVPVDVLNLWKHLSKVSSAKGKAIHIVPGLLRRGERVNVMRGEETQILGALTSIPSAKVKEVWICLPGTHSKWARIRNTTVEDFETFMTGEVYATLCKHTILGRTMKPGGRFSGKAFDRGVKIAESAERLGVLSNIFSVRTLGLTGQLTGAEQSEYLSGLLIGHEINALAALCADTSRRRKELHPIVLVGESSLCARYERALTLRHYKNVTIAADATTRGLWRIAVQVGLV